MRNLVKYRLSVGVAIVLTTVFLALAVDGSTTPTTAALSIRPPSPVVSMQTLATLHFP